MIKAYYNKVTLQFKNRKYKTHSAMYLADENKGKKQIKYITWENLAETYRDLGFFLNFTFWNFKRGKIISFYDFSPFDKSTWDVKEWKEPDLKFKLEIEPIEAQVSISDILNYHDSDLAIEYLKERSLNINSDK